MSRTPDRYFYTTGAQDVTVDSVVNNLPAASDRTKFSRESLQLDLQTLQAQGKWNPGIGELTIQFAHRYGMLAAQRLIENGMDYRSEVPESAFNFLDYVQDVAQVFNVYGKTVGVRFCQTYKDAIHHGFTPQQLTDFAKAGIDQGGKVFAAWSLFGARDLTDPDLAEEYQAAAFRVYKKGGLDVTKAFTGNVVPMQSTREQGIDFHDYAGFAEQATDSFHPKGAYWVVRTMPNAAQRGYHPETYIADAQEIHEQNPRAVRWYGIGIQESIKVVHRAEQEIQERQSAWSMGEAADFMGLRHDHEIERLQGVVNAYDFGKYPSNFKQILSETGLTGATAYVAFLKLFPDAAVFRDLPYNIAALDSRVSKKNFRDILWRLPKMAQDMGHVKKIMEDFYDAYDEVGEEYAVEALRYTHGLLKRRVEYRFTHPSQLEEINRQKKVDQIRKYEEGIIELEENSMHEYADSLRRAIQRIQHELDHPEDKQTPQPDWQQVSEIDGFPSF